ncbi:unnamed protein product [Phytomonas sp. Hart1]|nr:unnamed protein product [Phytomonas sp. Hart1]|eukprot:CCW68172.1 unnamed protein product [Phytomonas sp. isolate Hart1]
MAKTDRYKSYGLRVVGGPQGPKSLLDAVREAVVSGSIDTIKPLTNSFLSIPENVSKCICQSGNSIAHLAIGKDPTMLKYVLETLKGNVNAVNFQGRTPLHEAVTHNYVECCKILLDHGADDSLQSSTLSTPFHTAASCGSVECMEILLQHSGDPVVKVNELDKNKSSALHKCAFGGDVQVSRWLVEHGAKVDEVDCMGLTPLLVAVKMGQKDVAEYLLSQKANRNKQDNKGNSCIHFCVVRCDIAILNMLLSAGANPNVVNTDGCNPLHIAAINQRPDSQEWEELVATLLLSGCNPQHENISCKKPADYLGRGLKKLLVKEEVQHRRELELKAQKELAQHLEKNIATRSRWSAKMYNSITKREELERMEDERMTKEADDLFAAEMDIRTIMEELAEKFRFLEAEIIKKKALVEKASSKGK